MEIRECKRCLLREMGEEELYQRIRRTLAAIPAGQRCDDSAYESRPAACQSCEKLLGGLCRVCGCFVEVRAAWKNKECPAPERYWKKVL